MGQNRDRSLDADGQPKNYEPADPSLRSYHRGVWQLSLDGGLVGHIASVVGEIRFPYRAPWLWFLVIWIDGRRECPFEDYGPAWYTLRDIDAGYLEYHLPSAAVERRFLWWRMSAGQQGAPQKYDVEELPSDLAARRWEELALQDDQF